MVVVVVAMSERSRAPSWRCFRRQFIFGQYQHNCSSTFLRNQGLHKVHAHAQGDTCSLRVTGVTEVPALSRRSSRSMHTTQLMLLLACGGAAADSATTPSKPDLRSVSWMHQRVQVMHPDAAPNVPDVVLRIINPRHPEPLWLSKPEIGLLGTVMYGIWMYACFTICAPNIAAVFYAGSGLVDTGLTLCEHHYAPPCGEARSRLIAIVIGIVGVIIYLFSVLIASCIGSAAVITSAVLVLAGRGLIVRATSSAGSYLVVIQCNQHPSLPL